MPKATEWKKARAEAVNRGLVDPERVAELRERSLQEVRAHRLAEIRQGHGMTQTDVALALGVTQSRVSRIEHGELDRNELATLRSYVEALGGRIRIIAEFGDEQLVFG